MEMDLDTLYHQYLLPFVGIVFGFLMAGYYGLEKLVKLCLPAAMFEKDIAGQVVLLTGGGSGIGRLMCLKFARLGATVVTWDINTRGNEETVAMVEREGHKAVAYTVDMSNRSVHCSPYSVNWLLLMKLYLLLS